MVAVKEKSKPAKVAVKKTAEKATKKVAVTVKKNTIKVAKEKTEQRLVAPWARNSVQMDEGMTVPAMLKKAGLDWTVERYPAVVNIDGESYPVGREAIVRSTDKRVLSVATKRWNHFDNEVVVDFADRMAKKLGNRINYLGSVRGGQLIFALSELQGEKFDLFKGNDTISSYLLLSNPHVYGQAADVRFTAVRDRCYNTLTQGLARKGDLEIRMNHRGQFDPDFAEQALMAARVNMKKYEEMSRLLASKTFNKDSLIEYYQAVFPTLSQKRGRAVDKLSRPGQVAFDSLETQPGAEFGRGTWWQAYNSATYALDHIVGRNPDNRLYASWYGLNRMKKNQALKVACNFAEAA